MKRWIVWLMAAAWICGYGQPFVVVELFTSQGCSSCPPADELLAELADEHTEIIGLAYHVDYWDRLGWEDPYGSAWNTSRQHHYNRVLETGRVYTPQMVVGGREEFVGSDGRRARAAIASARQTSNLELESVLEAGRVQVTVGKLNAYGGKSLLVAITTDATTRVKRGENRGKTLRERFIVREAQQIEVVDATQRVDLALPRGDASTDYTLVALVQEPRTMAVLAAARERLSPP